jgi:peroxiredoxin
VRKLSKTYVGLVAASCLALGLVAGAAPQPSTPPTATRIDVAKLGPQVGVRVPDFSLKDQHGKTWTLVSIMGPKGAMILFYRSADWCPYCKTQLLDLQDHVKELQARGLGVAAISYDTQEILATFSAKHGISFPLLADVGSETITRYGILNRVPEEAFGPDKDDPVVRAEVQRYVAGGNPSTRMIGIAFPGAFFVDRQGRVTSRFFEDFYVERNTMASLMLRLGQGKAPVEAMKVATPHLDITTYPSDATVAPGNRFALAAEIAPHPGVHVYAPGTSGYRVVALTVAADPAVRLLPQAFPASEIYVFKPLNERVPVYLKPFTLVQEVVLEGTPQAQAALRGKDGVTLSGTLAYQACDDRVCFNPVSIPLTWKIGLKAIVNDRAPAPRPQ